MKRTDGMTGATPARRPRATPYPYPYPYPYPFLETPSKRAFQSAIAPRPQVTAARRRFSVLDDSDEEEKEEEVELGVEIKQEEEEKGIRGKKRKSLVGHSPDPKYVSCSVPSVISLYISPSGPLEEHQKPRLPSEH